MGRNNSRTLRYDYGYNVMMDIKKLVITVVTTLTVGVLSWQLNTVNNLETDVEVMKYKIETLEKYVKKLQKRKK